MRTKSKALRRIGACEFREPDVPLADVCGGSVRDSNVSNIFDTCRNSSRGITINEPELMHMRASYRSRESLLEEAVIGKGKKKVDDVPLHQSTDSHINILEGTAVDVAGETSFAHSDSGSPLVAASEPHGFAFVQPLGVHVAGETSFADSHSDARLVGLMDAAAASCATAPMRSTRQRFRRGGFSRRRRSRQRTGSYAASDSARTASGPPATYVSLGPCNRMCRHCKAMFWFEERIKHARTTSPEYHRCCGNGKVVLPSPQEYPLYIHQLFTSRHFMENIRAYNSMFAMTSLGATVDDSINRGRGPYVFKVSGQIYHRIGGLCPAEDTDPRFLQLYIFDTQNEVNNRLQHFQDGNVSLRPQIVRNLIQILDRLNELVRLFRTARDMIAYS